MRTYCCCRCCRCCCRRRSVRARGRPASAWMSGPRTTDVKPRARPHRTPRRRNSSKVGLVIIVLRGSNNHHDDTHTAVCRQHCNRRPPHAQDRMERSPGGVIRFTKPRKYVVLGASNSHTEHCLPSPGQKAVRSVCPRLLDGA